jgi:hypothetical protein
MEHAWPPLKTDRLPESGKVLLYHPVNESAAERKAAELGVPYYMYHSWLPLDQLFVLDLDELWKVSV